MSAASQVIKEIDSASTKQAREIAKSAVRALGYYANENCWKEDGFGCKSVIVTPDYGQGGDKARKAINRIGRMLR